MYILIINNLSSKYNQNTSHYSEEFSSLAVSYTHLDRIPFRFIVAPTDVENNNKNWMAVQGVNDGGQNQNPDFTTTANTGCRWYGTAGAPGAGRCV